MLPKFTDKPPLVNGVPMEGYILPKLRRVESRKANNLLMVEMGVILEAIRDIRVDSRGEGDSEAGDVPVFGR